MSSPLASVAEVSVTEVSSAIVPTSSELPTDRAAIGQLLGRLLRHFRTELFAAAAAAGYSDVREPHLQIFGNIYDGARLTELASRAQLSLAATSELVNDLQQLGYVERRPDPQDGRAKLIVPTPLGRAALAAAGDRVAEIEEHWASLIGRDRFAGACRAMQDLLDALDTDHEAQQAHAPSSGDQRRSHH
jgi:DNA-binding MarR family transcriptional regulator